MNKRSKLSRRAGEYAKKYNCPCIALLDRVMRLVGRLPEWVYGRRWLLGLLFAMLMGKMFAAARKARRRGEGALEA
jgi:hypothetical protein